MRSRRRPAGAGFRFRTEPVLRLDDLGPGFQRLTGHDPAALLEDRDRFWRVIHPEDQDEFRSFVTSPMESIFPRTFWLIHRDGDLIEVEAFLVDAVDGERGSGALIDGLFLEARAGTTIERRVAGLVTAFAEGFRGSIGVLSSASTTLASEEAGLSALQREEILSVIQRSGHRLDDLLSRIVELARLQGEAPARLSRIPASDVVHAALLEAPPPPDVTVRTDLEPSPEIRVEQPTIVRAIEELLRNAYRHGGRHLDVEVADHHGRVAITVLDDGEGVPADIEALLFEPFSRRGDRHGQQGPGLGLSIARAAVRRSGGVIRYRPRSPSGASFSVRLLPSEAAGTRRIGPPRRLRVAVLAADRLAGDSLAIGLLRSPEIHDAVPAGTVTDLLSAIAGSRVDVAIVDLDLPAGGGVDATRRVLRASPSVRILLVGSVLALDDLATAMDLNVGGLVPKELGLRAIVDAVERLPHEDVFIDTQSLLRLARASPSEPGATLTEREIEVLQLLAQGRNPSRIARDLGVQLSTCRGYIKAVLAKLGVHTQLEAVVTAYRWGLVSPGRRGEPERRGEQPPDGA